MRLAIFLLAVSSCFGQAISNNWYVDAGPQTSPGGSVGCDLSSNISVASGLTITASQSMGAFTCGNVASATSALLRRGHRIG